jgi:L,D-peptidoglycan transpeptidase YkuD (ErfK/YbiS/YcfS/YnhG family)
MRSGARVGLLATVLAAGLVNATATPASATGASSCLANLASRLADTSGASELITVEAPELESTTASLELWRRSGGCLERVGGPYLARLGAHGLAAHRHEGDLTTPMGTFRIGPEMYGALADPGLAYPYHELVCGDWWDEDPTSPAYNEFVHVACGTRPSFGRGEALWTELPAYDYFAVIEYNVDPVVPGAGSGIFLHLAGAGPTEGCVSLRRGPLLATLRFLRPADRPLIAIGTAATL